MDDYQGMPWDGARFSPDRKYRYLLWRTWAPRESPVVFIGLNPSIADETRLDPTVTRLCNFAKRWGFGGIRMLNMFALVSTDPRRLLKVDDPVGELTDRDIKATCRHHTLTVVCWGAHKLAEARAEILVPQLREWCDDLKCFGKNQNGSPKHPLYLKSTTTLKPF